MGHKKDKLREYQVEDWNIEPAALSEDPPVKRRTTVCPSATVSEMREIVLKATNLDPWANSDYSKEHLLDCLLRIESGEVSGDKAHRWLGWVQGVLGARGNGTIKGYAEINKRSKR